MKALRRQLLGGIVLGLVSVVCFAAISSAAGPTIQPSGITAWNPSTASVTTSETVTFKNASGVPHGVKWTGGPSTPNCPGIPTGTESGASWEGSCTFSQPGTYPFMCTVHVAMTGTITVTSAGPQKPTVTTLSGTAPNETEAELTGTVNPNGQTTEYFYEYGTTTTYDHSTAAAKKPVGAGTAAVAAPETLTGLAPSTTYHFRLVAENATGTENGQDKTVTTLGPEAPTVTTGGATVKSDTEADLTGTVNPNRQATEYFYEYGTTTTYDHSTAATKKPVGSGSAPVAAPETLTGLTKGTTYHYRLFAVNPTGTREGADKTFTTTGPPIPITGAANPVSDVGATLLGTVNPAGHATNYFFEYGKTVGYGQESAAKPAGAGTTPVNVSAEIGGLEAVTEYHYRVVAESVDGTVPGPDKTFKTGSTPPKEETTTPPPAAGSSTSPPATTSPPPPPGPTGPALGAAKVTPGKHGAPVKGSVEVLAPGAGGKLVVELKTKGKKGASAGKSTKASVPAGKASFSVPLNAKAKSTLKAKGKLTLTVTIVLTPPGGAPATVTRSVTVTA